MLWMFKDKRPWFAPKRYGLGAGLPIAWQGWLLIAAYLGTLGGIGVLSERSCTAVQTGAFALFLIVTGLFGAIVWKRTQGGWHWRWGGK